MKKFFGEFKKFITRGNVLDMSVGVIVGGAFTAIVNGLSNNILKPVINFILALIFKKDSLSEMYTFLGDPVYKNVLDENGLAIGTEVDLANSIYIDWGSFINAIINFLLTAFVLFIIVKFMNNLKDTNDKLRSKAKKVRHKELRKMKAEGDILISVNIAKGAFFICENDVCKQIVNHFLKQVDKSPFFCI